MTMKGKIKKLLATILVLGMSLSFELTALAQQQASDNEQTGKITIHQFNVNDFDNLKKGDGTEIDEQELPAESKTVEGVVYVLERLEGTVTSPEEAEKAVGTYVAGGKTDQSGILVFDHLSKGYYKITQNVEDNTLAQAGVFYVAMPTILADQGENFDIHVYPKTERQAAITMERNGEKQVLGIGDTASWSIHCRIAKDILENSKGEKSNVLKLQVKDVMDSRMDYVKAKTKMSAYDRSGNQIEGLTMVEGEDYIESYDSEKHEVLWTYQATGIQKILDYNVAEVQINIHTCVNDSIIGTQENLWNESYLYIQTAEKRTLSSEVFDINEDKNAVNVPKAYVGSISVYEKDEDHNQTLISGASLKIAKSREDALAGRFLQVSYPQSEVKAAFPENLLPVVHAQEITDKIDFEVQTDKDGAATFEGLGSGDYWLVETEMPEEYSANAEPIQVTVGNTEEDAHAEVIIEHKKVSSQTSFDVKKLNQSLGTSTRNWIASTVKTGDHTEIWLWCGVVLLALGVIFSCIRKSRKETDGNEEKK